VSTDLLLLVLAGVGAGLCGSVAGLASLVSYPALLAFGLPPLAANVTNSVSMVATTTGTMLGSQHELRGQGRRTAVLAAQSALGGAVGAALLLLTPPAAFEVVVPWLVALGAVLLLGRDRVRAWAVARRERLGDEGRRHRWLWPTALFTVGIYGGYFGAGVGVILLAVLAARHMEPLAVTNAVKNAGSGASNAVAALVYVFLAPVSWWAMAAMAVGMMVGGLVGPRIVRVTPERTLRNLIGLAGLGLAVYLATG
jgi:uncharacterized membrane protein YfcA